MTPPAIELTAGLDGAPPGRALDLACGGGRHAVWLRDRGWAVTAVDLVAPDIDGITCIVADLERDGFSIGTNSWDAIVCWLYWQENLLPAIAQGIRPGGIVAIAGKTNGRFATSLRQFRRVLGEWTEISSGENDSRVYLIARRATRPRSA